MSTYLMDLLLLETRGEGLSNLLGLLSISDAEGVQEARASDLELHAVLGLLDGNHLGILAVGLLQEVFDFGDLLRHRDNSSFPRKQIRDTRDAYPPCTLR
eukprot:TRINITY_DN6793_c0_g2_i2.p1 TRINITY_DN6793_c0_g2~~TRINITY_DN6793_c0_g2_i2.p1  ORF type:complete len:100 (+),score=4.15 TRINITY_DN6793_c0_g2_i2:241-540(+)